LPASTPSWKIESAANKVMGLRNLPLQSWTVNRGWVLAANIAADIDAWTRLLGLHDQPGLPHAEPDTLRYRLRHLPARLTRHARRRCLTISETWPCATRSPNADAASAPCSPHLTTATSPDHPERTSPARRPGAPAATRADPTTLVTKRANRIAQEGTKHSEESRPKPKMRARHWYGAAALITRRCVRARLRRAVRSVGWMRWVARRGR
jgi:hypothetical protein